MIGLTSITFRKLTCEEIIRLAQESRESASNGAVTFM